MGKEEKKELISVINSGWFTEASKTKKFENMFTKFVGSKYACAVTSGTVALYLGLKALGIGKGDEVIVPDFTFIASPNAVEATGAKPILIDIEYESLTLNLKRLSKLVNKKTKAIMPVHINGRSTNMIILREFADKNNLFLIEDAAQSLGSYCGKKHQGTIGDIGAFSFSTPKIITTGQGGLIVTNNKKLYNRCMELKDFGRKVGTKKIMRKAFEHDTIGYNFKFTEFQAAVGIAQMKKLDKRIIKKKKLFKQYKELLSCNKKIEFVKTNLNKTTPLVTDVIIKSKNLRNRLITHLEKHNIETRIYFPPLHRLKPYKSIDSRFKVASDISDRGLCLPSSIRLNSKQLQHVCEKINRFL